MDERLAYDMGIAFGLGKRSSRKANDAEEHTGEKPDSFFTTKTGSRVPVFEGQSKKEALKSFVDKKTEEKRKAKEPAKQSPEAEAKMDKALKGFKEKHPEFKAANSTKDIPKEVRDRAAGGIPATAFGVHYSDSPDADRVAVYYDAKGRAHNVYTKQFEAAQAAKKYESVRKLNAVYPEIKSRIDGDSKHPDPKINDIGLMTRLIAETGTRIGSEYDRGGKVKAYGASTLQGKHIVQEGGKTYLRYVGKEGVKHNHELSGELAQQLVERSKKVGPDANLFSTRSDVARVLMKERYSFRPKDLRTRLRFRWSYSPDRSGL